MPRKTKNRLVDDVKELLKQYNRQYNNTKVYSPKLIWKLLGRIIIALGSPFGKQEHQAGPKYTYKPKFYVRAFLFKVYFDLTYREAQNQIEQIHGSCANFRSLCQTAIEKIPYEYIAKVVKLLALFIRRILARAIKTRKQFIIGDSTGLSHSIKDGHKKICEAWGSRQEIRVKGHTKLYINARYVILLKEKGTSYEEKTIVSVEPRYYKTRIPVRQKVCRGITWLESISVGTAYTHDGTLFKNAFDKKFNREKFLLDAAFDDDKNVIGLLHSNKCQPHIKLRCKPPRSNLRKWLLKQFDKELFKYRSIVEGRFGAIKTRSRRIRSKNINAQKCEVSALASAMQVRTFLRLAFATGYKETQIMRFFLFFVFHICTFYTFYRLSSPFYTLSHGF
jgi:hypothetical protein